MEYQHITALVPTGEHFDATAMNNEGIWLTPAHVNAIENTLGESADAASTLATQVNDLTASVESISGQLQSTQSDLQNAQAKLGHKDAEIQKLNEQIAELKKAPAGGFSNTPKDEDETPADPKQKYMNSPVTQAAMKYAK